MASVWPEPNRLTWSMAASSDGTTATLILRARNSRPKSSSVASPIAGTRARAPASPTSSTPCSTSALATAGRKASATASCTTSDSAALHTLGRWVLALTTMSSAPSRSADGVDVDVAVAVAVDDHGDGRVVADALDQRRTTARDEAVDDVGELHELDRGFVAHVVDEQHRVGGEAGLGEAVAQRLGDGEVGAQRAGGPAEDGDVARLQADAGGVAGDVGPVLVDDRDHAERHPAAFDLQPVGPDASRRAPRRSGRAARRRRGRPSAMPAMRASVRRSRSSGPASRPAASAASTSRRFAASRSPARSSSRSAAASEGGVLVGGRRRRQRRRRGLRPPPSSATGVGRHGRRFYAGPLRSPADSAPRDPAEGIRRSRISGGVRPCRPAAALPGWVLRPRRPGLTFLPLLADCRSPPKRTLPPPADDELVRQECDGTRPCAQGRVREKSVRQGRHDEVVPVDDLVGQRRPRAPTSAGPRPGGAPPRGT